MADIEKLRARGLLGKIIVIVADTTPLGYLVEIGPLQRGLTTRFGII
jgi:hypothetical protein